MSGASLAFMGATGVSAFINSWVVNSGTDNYKYVLCEPTGPTGMTARKAMRLKRLVVAFNVVGLDEASELVEVDVFKDTFGTALLTAGKSGVTADGGYVVTDTTDTAFTTTEEILIRPHVKRNAGTITVTDWSMFVEWDFME